MESSRASLALRTHFKVLSLEPHKSSKMSYPRLEDSTFFVSLKISHGHDLFFTLLGKSAKTSRKIWKEFFFSGGRLKKILRNFFLGGEHLRLVFLALASRMSVRKKSVFSLGLGFFLCPWPPRLRPRLHLCKIVKQGLGTSFTTFN